ncbi:glycosyl transferase group 1 [Cellulomonas flavigena DSM 20109]|uniref:Glycosyl transferase group 1 n=1 Tax=Cellulomonas flavigena (strain ATCC 482 / DSM 20109 / BCRC 11376 / JCM 18109 / NBRC 3775 / NCIMB 8073 / NRS 134) TaxID=446466 RepID=D5UHC6_CELFN|nr:glycosyltransferase family 1 protein [Cellulomonas flavigena]ADG75247.1 glycosyl transferase group 1 [Cellulomonas flavigena DSM 20109]
MRILLDATAVPADRGGVGRYLDDLLPALVRQGVDLVVVSQERDRDHLARLAPSAEVVAAPARIERRPARLVWEQVALPRLARGTRADVLHSPHYTMPLVPGVPVVVTLHDATFFSHPELHSPVKRRFFRTATRHAVRRAGALVVPSRATAREVRRHAGGAEALFHVAYHGVDTSLFHRVDGDDQARVARSLDLEGRPYVGFLGTLEPRKNVPALVRAWARSVTDLPEPPALVLAGGRGWDEQVAPTVAAVRAQHPHLVVRTPGYLPLGDLPGFLSGARVLAYPSLGEGFGLPVLEAMACGAVVLTTRELSLPEVGGEAVAYCGTDEESIARELRTLLDDAPRRERLAAAAVERAAGFDWDASARAHVAAYEAALGRRA